MVQNAYTKRIFSDKNMFTIFIHFLFKCLRIKNIPNNLIIVKMCKEEGLTC